MPAHAGSFSISPIRLDLSDRPAPAALTVRNDDAKPWSRRRSCSGSRSTARTGSRRRATCSSRRRCSRCRRRAARSWCAWRCAQRRPDTTRELSYRLILQEVPQTANPDFSGLQVALRLSVPVFVANAGTTGPALAWSAAAPGDGLALTAQNSGDVHARIHGFSVAPAAGDGAPLVQPVAALHTSRPARPQLEPRSGTGGHDIGRQLAPSAVEGHDRRRRIRNRTRHHHE